MKIIWTLILSLQTHSMLAFSRAVRRFQNRVGGFRWDPPIRTTTTASLSAHVDPKLVSKTKRTKSIITLKPSEPVASSGYYPDNYDDADLQLVQAHHLDDEASSVAHTQRQRQQQSPETQRLDELSVDDMEDPIEQQNCDFRSLDHFDSVQAYLHANHFQSTPQPDGNWNVQDPLGWTKQFGRRSESYENDILKPLIGLGPGDQGYYDVKELKCDKVAIVRNKNQADIVLQRLMAADPNILHACDTEVMDIDLKSVGPVGNGYVTCVSVYSGPDFDYGLGQPPGSTLWIDNLDDAKGVLQFFKEWFENPKHLKVWHNYGFDRHVMWNEGIDVQGFGGDTMHMARLLDTSRAKNGGGYSLEALTGHYLQRRKRPMKELFGVPRLRKDGSPGSIVDIPPVEVLQRDPKFRESWIKYSAYDAIGTYRLQEHLQKELVATPWLRGKNLMDYYWMHMRPFGEVLTDMERRGIRVDARDYLAGVEILAREQRAEHDEKIRKWAAQKIGADGWIMNIASAAQLCTFLFGGAVDRNGKQLVEPQRVFKTPRSEIPEEYLKKYEEEIRAKQEAENKPAASSSDPSKIFDDMKAGQLKELCKSYGLKVAGKKADLQERLRLFFENGGPTATATSSPVSVTTIDGKDIVLETLKVAELKELCKEHDLKRSGKKAELIARLQEAFGSPSESESVSAVAQTATDDFDGYSDGDLRDSLTIRGLSIDGTREELLERLREDIAVVSELHEHAAKDENPLSLADVIEQAQRTGEGPLAAYFREKAEKENEVPKYVDLKISGLGLTPIKQTAGGSPSVTADVLRKLAGEPFADPPKYGTAYDKLGKEGCEALFSLCSVGSIDTMIANFLTSLQELADEQDRVHCSMNINTETGRLSSRRPNLQNQPALEKDVYKIRKAFEASPGNKLIVADYGQLELRILASVTNCKSMIDAFEAGGDFHSRTAVDMFDYVKKKLDDGECLLEWDYANGEPPKPLVKDLFASERRKAKTLNFSIAYGKTAHGLSEDWGVTKGEAEAMLQAWYDARPEVRTWQDETKSYAKTNGITRTLMGRYRHLPYKDVTKKQIGQAQRASINTPIQGGAADIAMMAMNKINKHKKLQALGWVLLLQIHDEVILEGPEETAAEAFEIVRECMESPWVFGLGRTPVPLLVDGSYTHTTWYDAK